MEPYDVCNHDILGNLCTDKEPPPYRFDLKMIVSGVLSRQLEMNGPRNLRPPSSPIVHLSLFVKKYFLHGLKFTKLITKVVLSKVGP